MRLKFTLAGSLDIADDKIDITDPCYDNSVWCRTQKPIIPGRYNCYAGEGSKWGRRVYSLILLADGFGLDGRYDVQSVANIGVDAGLAGFFVNKPDYSDDEWDRICEYIFKQDGSGQTKKFWIVDENSPLKCKGFFSESGVGDGVYLLYEVKHRGKIIGYKLEF